MQQKSQTRGSHSSQPDFELQEIENHKPKRPSQDHSVPLLEQPQPQEPHEPFSTRFRFLRSLFQRGTIPLICLGFMLILIIIIIIFLFKTPEPVPGYKVTRLYEDNFQYSMLLEPNLPSIQLSLRDVNKTLDLLPTLNVSILCYSQNHFRVKIKDTEGQRWEIPDEYPYPFVENPVPCNYKESNLDFSVRANPFALKITRKSTGESIFDTKDSPLVFSKHYMELTNHLSSFDFFGLGQRLYKLQMGPGNYTIWPKDIAGDIETGESGHNNYGHQPIYLLREPSGNYHIVLLRNSNAMEIQIRKDRSLKYQVIGGVFDFHIFVGSKDPEAIIERYHEYLGKWTIPPFWSMGFHQSKWGYRNLSDLTNVLQGYKDHNIPLDVIWSDIDYMINYLDFTIDEKRFPIEGLQAMLSDFDKKWVPIIDAGIGTSNISQNIAYEKGLEKDLFIKNKQGKNLQAWVWPNETVFPDFFHPETESYWMEMFEGFYNTVPFDGIWLDMNEVSNFCHGECNTLNPNASSYLPFVPGKTDLEIKTISLDAVHYGNIQESDVHSLFNILQQKATWKYIKKITPLPFILTRANVFGSGKFSSHWFGDTRSDWVSMRYTVPSLIKYNLFGMPHVGTDICGYMGDTTPELCTRWTQLGVFYPFARNHHEKFTLSQEPYRFEPEFMQPMIDSIRFRYSILKHFYTLFVSKNGTGTIIRPLYFEFPEDQSLFRHENLTEIKYVEEQFMLGKALMVTPILHIDVNKTEVYFPEGAWYNFLTSEHMRFKENSNRTLNVSIETVTPVFMRGGYIVMVQDSSTVMSSKDLNNEFSMIIALSEEKNANYGPANGMKSLSSRGEILDIQSYDEETVYEQCILNDCVLELVAKFEWDLAEPKVVLIIEGKRRDGSSKQIERGIIVNEIKILGNMMKDINVDSLNISNDDKSVQISSDQIEKIKDSLVIKIVPGILMEGGSTFKVETSS